MTKAKRQMTAREFRAWWAQTFPGTRLIGDPMRFRVAIVDPAKQPTIVRP